MITAESTYPNSRDNGLFSNLPPLHIHGRAHTSAAASAALPPSADKLALIAQKESGADPSVNQSISPSTHQPRFSPLPLTVLSRLQMQNEPESAGGLMCG